MEATPPREALSVQSLDWTLIGQNGNAENGPGPFATPPFLPTHAEHDTPKTP